MKYVIGLLIFTSAFLAACDNQKTLNPIEQVKQEVKAYLLTDTKILSPTDTQSGYENHLLNIFNQNCLNIPSFNAFIKQPTFSHDESLQNKLNETIEQIIKEVATEKFAQLKNKYK